MFDNAHRHILGHVFLCLIIKVTRSEGHQHSTPLTIHFRLDCFQPKELQRPSNAYLGSLEEMLFFLSPTPPPKKKSGHVQNRHKSKGPMLWIIFPKTGKNNVRCWQEELQTILASFINLLLFPYTSPQNVQQTIWPISRKTSSSQDSPLKGTSTNRRFDHWDVCLGYHHGLRSFDASTQTRHTNFSLPPFWKKSDLTVTD